MVLVITIIILLILAGITIGAVTGDNGLIKQAKSAKNNTERSDIEEKINVMVVQSMKKTGNIEKDILLEKLHTLPREKEIVDSEDKIYVIYPEYNFEIDIDSGDVIDGKEIERVKDETPWELAGEGTEENPYLIESIEDLVAFSNSVNQGNDYQRKYIKLANNLDFNLPFSYDNSKTKVLEKENRIITEDVDGMELKTFLTTGTGFNPIGGTNKNFLGIFDGNGKEIKNIYINRENESRVGLFGCCYAGIIRRIGITGEIIGDTLVGGICADNEYGEIKESYNGANITGKNRVGGIER